MWDLGEDSERRSAKEEDGAGASVEEEESAEEGDDEERTPEGPSIQVRSIEAFRSEKNLCEQGMENT